MSTTTHRLPAESLTTLEHRVHEVLSAYPIVPDTFTEEFDRTLASLMCTAGARQIRTVSTLLDQAEALITDTCGMPIPTRWTPTKDRATFHQHRNVLLTMVVAAYLATATFSTRDQPHPKDLIGPAAAPRTAEPDRAMTEDEIALARAWALVSCRYPQKRQAAATYALGDAGMRLAEVPLTRRSDFLGDPLDMVLAGGTDKRAARFLPLDGFHRVVLATLPELRTAGQVDAPILHRTRDSQDLRKSGEAAAARALRAFTHALGLPQDDLVPASAARWRVQHTWDTEDVEAAIDIAGTSRNAVESELGITPALKQQRPDHRPKGSIQAM